MAAPVRSGAGGRETGLPDYMRDWLARRAGPASDLDLAVLLLNSLDHLADPPDRLASLTWFREVTADAGRDDIAGALVGADLPGLRRLRDSLRAAFEAESATDVAALLNPLLAQAPSVPQLVVADGGLRLEVAPGARGLAALAARLPAAVATHVAQHGIGRLGTCAALPCRCAFVDYTRGGTRRFCCTACNDRAAAKQYRQRKRQS
jgi:predicted RNA-binding Zn ribbon-like protein